MMACASWTQAAVVPVIVLAFVAPAGACAAPECLERSGEMAMLQLGAHGVPLRGRHTSLRVLSNAARPPPIQEFDRRAKAMPSDPGQDLSNTSNRIGEVKMLIGVLSAGYESRYRDVHRRTWMKSSGPMKVCRVEAPTIVTHTAPPHCSIFATFLLGSDPRFDAQVTKEAAIHKDITLVLRDDGVPVQDDGLSNDSLAWTVKTKVFHWFRLATERFPWATHVMKMDMDTYPFPGKIARLLAAAKGKDDDKEWSPSLFKGRQPPPHGWSERHGVKLFWQGQFYGISASTLRCMYKELSDNFTSNGTLVGPAGRWFTKNGTLIDPRPVGSPKEGSRAFVTGLKARPELNGRSATVLNHVAEDRFKVVMDDGTRLLIRRWNLDLGHRVRTPGAGSPGEDTMMHAFTMWATGPQHLESHEPGSPGRCPTPWFIQDFHVPLWEDILVPPKKAGRNASSQSEGR